MNNFYKIGVWLLIFAAIVFCPIVVYYVIALGLSAGILIICLAPVIFLVTFITKIVLKILGIK